MMTNRQLHRTTLLAAALLGAAVCAAAQDAPASATGDTSACVAIVAPSVEGVSDSGAVSASVQNLFVQYLTGPTLKSVPLQSRLASQAVQEAKQKSCTNVVTVSLVKTAGGGGHPKASVITQAAATASGYIPYAGATGEIAVGGAVAGTEAINNAATYTRAKDEMTIEYRVMGTDGTTILGTKTEKVKAKQNGEDLVTNLVAHAAEAIAGVVVK